ncbi:MAG: hypothetical protein D6772_12970 [Bacteroidetes bacterium]|nr:MAG: hypothetical protein D6772_12970 [Bacteroidota bacterium]
MRHLLLLCFSLSLISLSAQQLAPQQLAPLYQHLYEVNQEWLSQATPVEFQAQVRFSSDRERIQRHLQLVESMLRTRPLDQWTAEQQARRCAVLDILQDYWQAARFPLNRISSERIPVFIDPDNTACAVGHLMRETGAVALTEQIRAENNYAYIEDLLCYFGVNEWALTHGFTAEELAWIQPSYLLVYFEAGPLGRGLGINGGQGNASIMDMEELGDYLLFAGDFVQLDTFTATGLAAWDKEQWYTLSGAQPAWVAEMSYDQSTEMLYAYGYFPSLGSEELGPVLARHDGQDWSLVLSTEEVAVADDSLLVRDLICADGRCYLASNIKAYGENRLSALAVWSEAENALVNWSTDYQLTGEVFDLFLLQNELILGGRFTLARGEDTLYQHLAVLNPFEAEVVQDYDNIFSSSAYEVQAVNAVGAFNFGSEREITLVAEAEEGLLAGNTFVGLQLLVEAGQDYQVGGISPSGRTLYGKFPSIWSEDIFTLVNLVGESATPLIYLATGDESINALHSWDGALILAGDFTVLQNVYGNDEYEATHLAKASLLITDLETPADPVTLCTLATDGQQLFIRQLPAEAQELQLDLFDQQGRLVRTMHLYATDSEVSVQVADLPMASYVYRLRWKERVQTGQVVIVR